jgi:hypothetical protein
MPHSASHRLISKPRPKTWRRVAVDRPIRDNGLQGASMRLMAAMAKPGSPDGRHAMFGDAGATGRLTPFAGEAVESDVQYFRRRWAQERRASNEAAGPEARAAHRELAARYARQVPRTTWPHGLAPQIALSQPALTSWTC